MADIARLKDSIDRAAAATTLTLSGHPAAPEDDERGSARAERNELTRQLAALRKRTADAEHAHQDPAALRAELATLLSFAKTLRTDADRWRATLTVRLEELERRRTIVRREREMQAVERETLLRRREALRLRVAQTAARMAQRDGGEWRRTLPVFTLAQGLTVCSASVSSPRKGLRVGKRWTVTLNDARDDVLVKRW